MHHLYTYIIYTHRITVITYTNSNNIKKTLKKKLDILYIYIYIYIINVVGARL